MTVEFVDVLQQLLLLLVNERGSTLIREKERRRGGEGAFLGTEKGRCEDGEEEEEGTRRSRGG